MLRATILTALICAYSAIHTSMAAEIDVGDIQATSTLATSIDSSNVLTDAESIDKKGYYHPAEIKHPRVLEEFNRNFKDGSYEYKYILSNGVSRYEKSFWKPVGLKMLLARKGFYSHPLPNKKFITVFYTADEHGYQTDTTKYSNTMPTLPRHLEVPQFEIPQGTSTTTATSTTTYKPKTTTTRRTTTSTTTRKPRTTTITTTRKPKTTTTTTRQPLVNPSEFNWIY